MPGKQRVRYQLDSGDINQLSIEEIRAILRAADELISTGGRSLLAKILRGSKDKKIFEYKLDQCPMYGFYKNLTLQAITQRIDWMILSGYFRIEYYGKLPTIVYSDRGWEIERETFAEELLQNLYELMDSHDYSYLEQLKDRNRGMIFLLINKIKESNNARFIPILKAWKEIDYKKVQKKLQRAIDYLKEQGSIC